MKRRAICKIPISVLFLFETFIIVNRESNVEFLAKLDVFAERWPPC